MKTIEWLVIGSLLIGQTALAQEPNPYIGTWQVSMVNNQGGSVKGKVIINSQDGTWDMFWQSTREPCAGIKAPIMIKRASANKLVFKILRSESLKGCKNHVAKLKPVDETTLHGKLNDGRELTLVRE